MINFHNFRSIGFDKAYNYKSVDISDALRDGAPNGVDCYFDNVGGEHIM